MLQRLVCFVGFDLAALVAVFFRALFPLLDVHLVRFTGFQAAGQGILCRGDLLPHSGDAAFEFRKAFWEPAHALANFDQAEINGLQLNQVFEVGMHPRPILAQAARRAWITFHLQPRFSGHVFRARLMGRDA